jgi:GT2 family glycosyltransferase
MTRLEVPEVETPTVSVVVVTYGNGDTVISALESLAANTHPCYELIVIDNASSDGTGALLEDRLVGATVVVNEENLGFASGSNQGAALASGRYLCFLNPDAFVEPGWLPPLL